MWENWTRKEHADFNRQNRLSLYMGAAVWAALGGVCPFAYFLSAHVLHSPEPVSTTLEGYQRDGAPMGDSYEVYSHEWASGADETSYILALVLGVFAAAAVALIFYCIARFIADPIMYRIDLKTEHDSPLQLWLKRLIMVLVVLLYCGTIAFAATYEGQPEDAAPAAVPETEEPATEPATEPASEPEAVPEAEPATQPPTEPTTEDLSKTPVERGYPSNDLDYYIEHPDEPMPKELIDEVTRDSYNPGLEYDPGQDFSSPW